LVHPRAGLERVIGVGGLASVAVNTIVGSGIFGLPGIAAAIERLLDEAPLRARLAAAGLRRVNELTWSANADRVCEAISKFVEPSRG
jgi:hypothetical protein